MMEFFLANPKIDTCKSICIFNKSCLEMEFISKGKIHWGEDGVEFLESHHAGFPDGSVVKNPPGNVKSYHSEDGVDGPTLLA